MRYYKSSSSSILIIELLMIQCISVLCASENFDFFYFVQQWPGSYCDTKKSCCYPKSGKPASDFGIHGLWPNNNDGSWPSNCDTDSDFEIDELWEMMASLEMNWPSLSCPSSDGYKFWSHEWEKHGTCSESNLSQRQYFETALKLKEQIDVLNILKNAGIEPNGDFYSLNSIVKALKEGTGYTPGIECNKDSDKNSQLYQVYMCVDTSGSDFIECPILPKGKCASSILFPEF